MKQVYAILLLSDAAPSSVGCLSFCVGSELQARLAAIQRWEELEGKIPVGAFRVSSPPGPTWVKVYDTDVALGKILT